MRLLQGLKLGLEGGALFSWHFSFLCRFHHTLNGTEEAVGNLPDCGNVSSSEYSFVGSQVHAVVVNPVSARVKRLAAETTMIRQRIFTNLLNKCLLIS